MARTPAALRRDRELARARQRAYKARLRLERGPVDELDVTCWCEEAIIRVPRTLVLDGRTETCGRPGCEEAAA